MKIINDYLSISTPYPKSQFPFKKGDLVTGQIIKKLADGFYQIKLGVKEFKAQYPYELEGKHLFKVVENQGQLLLKLMQPNSQTPAGNKSVAEQIISQFPQLSSLSQDPLIQLIMNLHLKHNLRIEESEILTLYRYFKNRKTKSERFIETVINMKSKGQKPMASYIQKLSDYDHELSSLSEEINSLLKRSKDPLSQLLKENYLISLKEGELKNQLKNKLSGLGYCSRESIKNSKKNLFLVKLLKLLSIDKDNKLIRKLTNHFKLERESFLPNESETDQVFFSIPILLEDNQVDYFKLKYFPKLSNKRITTFFFELTLTKLKRIQGVCLVSNARLYLNLDVENKEAADFLNYFLEDLTDEMREQYPLVSCNINHKEKLGDFIEENGENIKKIKSRFLKDDGQNIE